MSGRLEAELVAEWLLHPLTPFFGKWIYWVLWLLSANLRAYWFGRDLGLAYQREHDERELGRV